MEPLPQGGGATGGSRAREVGVWPVLGRRLCCCVRSGGQRAGRGSGSEAEVVWGFWPEHRKGDVPFTR